MEKAAVNQEIMFPVPKGFHVMDEEELHQAFPGSEGSCWGIWDKEQHIILRVLWQNLNGLTAWLADMEKVAVNNEKLTAKVHEGFDYQPEGFFKTSVSSYEAHGYSFSYRRFDVTQHVETALFKKGKVIYSISCIGRSENNDRNHDLFSWILENIAAE
ncbi:MAG: hypothetical protein K6D03_12320 [Solobacterium sp.]|nr:hypothetical protein [Solobacterium sp.]